MYMSSKTETKEFKLSPAQREYHRMMYHKHKEKLNKAKYEKHTCKICGSVYAFGHRSTHEASKKHQLALKALSIADVILKAPLDRIQNLPLSVLLPDVSDGSMAERILLASQILETVGRTLASQSSGDTQGQDTQSSKA
jgi:hypothetical protein